MGMEKAVELRKIVDMCCLQAVRWEDRVVKYSG